MNASEAVLTIIRETEGKPEEREKRLNNIMTHGWGYYSVYDAVRSNLQAEAYFFHIHRRLVIMTLGEEHDDEVTIITIPSDGKLYESDPATTRYAIAKLLKDRFKTEYVAFHEFGQGNFV